MKKVVFVLVALLLGYVVLAGSSTEPKTESQEPVKASVVQSSPAEDVSQSSTSPISSPTILPSPAVSQESTKPTNSPQSEPSPKASTINLKAEESTCDPNYAGACVPIASDVDCASGNGNGPAYTKGPVKVIGSDIYGLDRDGDGVACEK